MQAPEIGLPELIGIGAVVVLILERVFTFISKQQERKEEASRPDQEAQIVSLMGRQTDLMERMVPMVEAIHRTADTYEKAGVCPLTKPDGRDSVARAIGREIKNKE